MISARLGPAFDRLAALLTARAKALAEASRLPADWRDARRLWPHFTRG